MQVVPAGGRPRRGWTRAPAGRIRLAQQRRRRPGAARRHPPGAGRLVGPHRGGGRRRTSPRRSPPTLSARPHLTVGRGDAAGDDVEPLVAVRAVGAASAGDRRRRRRATARRAAAAGGVERRRDQLGRAPGRRCSTATWRSPPTRRPARPGRVPQRDRQPLAAARRRAARAARPDRRPGHRRILLADVDTPWGRWPFAVDPPRLPVRPVGARASCRWPPCSTRWSSGAANPTTDLPVVVGGDFNAVPDSDEIRMVTGRSAPPRAGRAAERLLGARRRRARASPGGGTTRTRRARPGRSAGWTTCSSAGRAPSRSATRVAAWLAGVDPVDGIVPSDHAAVVVDLTTPPTDALGRSRRGVAASYRSRTTWRPCASASARWARARARWRCRSTTTWPAGSCSACC